MQIAWALPIAYPRLPIGNTGKRSAGNWEIGTRRHGGLCDIFECGVRYFDWLGTQVSDAAGSRAAQRNRSRRGCQSTGRMKHQPYQPRLIVRYGNLPVLADLAGVTNPWRKTDHSDREGCKSFTLDTLPAADIVSKLNAQGSGTPRSQGRSYSWQHS